MDFSRFAKPKADKNAMKQFWDWFTSYESEIIEQIQSRSGDEFIYEVDKRLLVLFPRFKGELEFEFGNNGVIWEFNFFDLNNRYLNALALELKNEMPRLLQEKWVLNILR